MHVTMMSSNILAASSISSSSDEIQINKIRELVDTLHDQYNSAWKSTLILDSDHYTQTNITNLDALEYAGKGSPFSHAPPKYFSPIIFSTTDGFKGTGYKSLIKVLCTSAKTSGYTIIQKGYYIHKKPNKLVFSVLDPNHIGVKLISVNHPSIDHIVITTIRKIHVVLMDDENQDVHEPPGRW